MTVPGPLWNGEGKPLITAGNLPDEGGVRTGAAQHGIPWHISLKAHEHAVVVLGVLIELPGLDTVIDDLRVDPLFSLTSLTNEQTPFFATPSILATYILYLACFELDHE